MLSAACPLSSKCIQSSGSEQCVCAVGRGFDPHGGTFPPSFLMFFSACRWAGLGSVLLGRLCRSSPGGVKPPFFFLFLLNCFYFKCNSNGFRPLPTVLTPLHQMTHMLYVSCVIFHKEFNGGDHFLNWGLHCFGVWHFAQRPLWHILGSNAHMKKCCIWF